MHIEFSGEIIFWRRPAQWFFVKVLAKHSRDIKAISNMVTYGWGVILVHVRIGEIEFTTFILKMVVTLYPSKRRFPKQKTLRKVIR